LRSRHSHVHASTITKPPISYQPPPSQNPARHLVHLAGDTHAKNKLAPASKKEVGTASTHVSNNGRIVNAKLLSGSHLCLAGPAPAQTGSACQGMPTLLHTVSCCRPPARLLSALQAAAPAVGGLFHQQLLMLTAWEAQGARRASAAGHLEGHAAWQ
jgi:hypothetical protein